MGIALRSCSVIFGVKAEAGHCAAAWQGLGQGGQRQCHQLGFSLDRAEAGLQGHHRIRFESAKADLSAGVNCAKCCVGSHLEQVIRDD